MSSSDFFVPISEGEVRSPDFWDPVVVSKEAIDQEIERLSDMDRPADGRREVLIVHPRAREAGEAGLGLAPGIRVSLSVLKPGEETAPRRHNATEVNFCIKGGGTAFAGGRIIRYKQYDVWNHPSWTTYRHVNDTDDIQVRLTYSNAALLERMRVHLVEDNPPPVEAVKEEEDADDPRKKSPYGTFKMADGKSMLMPYEILINPPSVESPVLHWPWKEVRNHLDKLTALGKDYVGRRLYLLYNEMTGRTNGTTPSFFATMTIRPPKIVDRPHRHISAAINYYFHGSGRSTVEGNVIPWKAGDLMLSAPGWATHNHASFDESVYELTIQDQPLNIIMESLLWQESLKMPASVLGKESGFATNRMTG